jgi:hypothetical protein
MLGKTGLMGKGLKRGIEREFGKGKLFYGKN